MGVFTTMVDMAKTPAEVKEDIAEMSPVSPEIKVPAYPYGLCISLTEEELPKLGLDGDLPEVGEMVHLVAMAKVTSVSENEREDTSGEKTRCCRVELQITHLAAENEDEEDVRDEQVKARRGRFYGNEEESEAA